MSRWATRISWFPYGLTSSDVVDRPQPPVAHRGRRKLPRCSRPRSRRLRYPRSALGTRHALHGPHAGCRPTTFGLKLRSAGGMTSSRERVGARSPASPSATLRRRQACRNVDPGVEDRALRRSAWDAGTSRRRWSAATGTPSCWRKELAILGSLCAAARRAPRRCRTSAIRSSASASAKLRACLTRRRARRLRGRSAVARKRDISHLGRARHPDRLDDARALPARPSPGSSGPRGVSRAHAAQHRRGPRADVLGERPAALVEGRALARGPMRSCSGTPSARSTRSSRCGSCSSTTSRGGGAARCRHARSIFDLDAALRNASVAFDRTEAAPVYLARARTSRLRQGAGDL